MKKLFPWGRTQRDRARQAVVQGVTDYSKKKPKTKAGRWASIASIIVGAAIFAHTGNPHLAKVGGDMAGGAIEHVIEERDDRGSAE